MSSAAVPPTDPLLQRFKDRKRSSRLRIDQKYDIKGFISSGTYGKVFKATSLDRSDLKEYAIKKFRPDESTSGTSGISQSACREIGVSSFVFASLSPFSSLGMKGAPSFLTFLSLS
jgi:serine/threonine protein kinase